MGRTMEAWMNVYNVGKTDGSQTHITQPFFHISQGTGDTAQVSLVKDGFFSLAYLESGAAGNNAKTPSDSPTPELNDLLPFVVDPLLVFDTDTTLSNPSGLLTASFWLFVVISLFLCICFVSCFHCFIGFFDSDMSVDDFVSQSQGTTSRTPCSFTGVKLSIPPGSNVTITSIYGYAENLETLTGKYSPIMRSSDYSTTKRALAQSLMEDIGKRVETKTNLAIEGPTHQLNDSD
jgi:hypothetical protein